ncbi:hypothetical protein PR048_020820 [Dryococelus australis]|uniref:DDE-1 domain-containing protein n=1 Tax=Dryococelus australis TaxID=614101 RepID=A0ABQ9GWH0_9NEOP|nr:hypothetical protein PR048_020820 [Dryococelus australis]
MMVGGSLKEKFHKLLDKEIFTGDQIFNCDETGLNFKILPAKTRVQLSLKQQHLATNVNNNLPRKAILLLGDAPSHPNEEQLEDGEIKAMFLPPNVTANCQPVDQGDEKEESRDSGQLGNTNQERILEGCDEATVEVRMRKKNLVIVSNLRILIRKEYWKGVMKQQWSNSGGKDEKEESRDSEQLENTNQERILEGCDEATVEVRMRKKNLVIVSNLRILIRKEYWKGAMKQQWSNSGGKDEKEESRDSEQLVNTNQERILEGCDEATVEVRIRKKNLVIVGNLGILIRKEYWKGVMKQQWSNSGGKDKKEESRDSEQLENTNQERILEGCDEATVEVRMRKKNLVISGDRISHTEGHKALEIALKYVEQLEETSSSTEVLLLQRLHDLAGTTVAERLDCSPSKVIQVQFPCGSLLEIVRDNVTGWRVFLGISHFPRHCMLVLLHSHLISSSSPLKTSLSRNQHHSLCPAKNQMGQHGRDRDIDSPQSSGSSLNMVGTCNDERVTLVVDSTRFVMDPSLFTAHPNTMLGSRTFSMELFDSTCHELPRLYFLPTAKDGRSMPNLYCSPAKPSRLCIELLQVLKCTTGWHH